MEVGAEPQFLPRHVEYDNSSKLRLPAGFVMAKLPWRAAQRFRHFRDDFAVVRHRLAQRNSPLKSGTGKPNLIDNVKAVPMPVLMTIVGSERGDIVGRA